MHVLFLSGLAVLERSVPEKQITMDLVLCNPSRCGLKITGQRKKKQRFYRLLLAGAKSEKACIAIWLMRQVVRRCKQSVYKQCYCAFHC